MFDQDTTDKAAALFGEIELLDQQEKANKQKRMFKIFETQSN